MEEFCGSVFWDEDLTWNTDDPDFTECFLQTALVYAPFAFLLLFSPLELYYTWTSKYSNIPWGLHNCSRLLLICLLVAHAVVDLVQALTWVSPDIHDVHWVTPTVRIVMFLYIAVLTLIQRKRGITSSPLLTIFWIGYTVLAIPQFRHEIRAFERRNESTLGSDDVSWADYQFVSYIVYFALLLVLTGFYFFVDKQPLNSRYDHIRSDKPNPGMTSGFVRHLMFFWFDSIMWQGYRNPLTDADMYDVNPEDKSSEINPRFEKYWNMDVEKKAKAAQRDKLKKGAMGGDDEKKSNVQETNGSILPSLWKTFCGPFLMSGLFKVFMDLLSFAPPQILGFLIAFTSIPDTPQWHGFVYTVAFLGISLLTALLNGQHQYLSFMVGYRIRAALVNAIYRKSLKLSSAARRGTTNGEVVNLMSVDAQRFFELIVYLHMIWSGPLVVILSMYFLWDLLGVSAFAGLVVLILLVPVNAFIANKLKYFQVKQMVKKDERIRAMNEIMGGMKVLKLYAWETSFEDTIFKMREKELQIIQNAAITNAYVFLMWNMVPFLVTLVTFLVFIYSDDNNKMTPNTLFVALSLFNILRQPMTMFPLMVNQVMQAMVAVSRINKYLNYEDLDPNAVSNNKDGDALKIVDGNFSWGEKEAPVLRNVNMSVKKGHLSAVVGPVGCGKSSLIFSMLGDTEKQTGNVNIDGSMAYIAQQAWIQNATLQDNILFGLPMEPVYYNKVLDACALLPDLKILPGGDQTEIGEKGINLSGGQKQRVALARAVYSRADIYLLDDPLSAVDSHVGKHIFDKVIGPAGILAGKTRLLVTHGISYLPQTNHIFVLSNGVISESGEYLKLLEQKGAFSEFLVEHVQNVAEENEDDLIAIKEALTSNPIGEKLFDRAISVRTSISKKKFSVTSKGSIGSGGSISKALSVKLDKPNVGTTLIQKEASAIGSVGLMVYWRYVKSVGYLFSSLIMAGTIGHQALSIFSNNWLSEWSAHPQANDHDVRALYLSVYGAICIAQGLTLFAASIVTAYGTLNAARILHNNMLHRSMRLPMEFFDTTPLGRITNRFTKDVDIVDNVLPQVIRAWLIMVFATLGTLIVISISTPIFIAVIIPLAIIYYFIQSFYVVTSRQLKRIESVTRSPIYSHFGETINGQTTIRAYNAQDRFRLTSEKHVDENQKSVYEALVSARWLGVRLEFIGALVLLFAALFAVLARGEIASELVGLSITYAMQITGTLSFLVRLTAELETNIVANERLEEYANEPMEAAWETEVKVDKQWPDNGAVKFDEVELRYRAGLDLVLKKVSFVIRGGEKIGIVGRTGAGKSSLTLALFRIIELANGKILIDDVPIETLGLQLLRARLTIIPQDPVLFGGNLRGNVDPFNKYTDDEVWNALENAHLKSFVKGTTLGLMHEIAEGGDNLSIGQKQLVCLARALLRKTKVLILDEATAAIDLETDNLIQTTIREQFKECTVLTIAHRLNTILDSDRVLVLDKGEVAELEPPQVLLNNTNSIFYGMAKDAGIVGNNTATHESIAK